MPGQIISPAAHATQEIMQAVQLEMGMPRTNTPAWKRLEDRVLAIVEAEMANEMELVRVA